MGEISQWSPVASTGYQFTTPAPDGAPEGMAASDVNDHARETMAAVRRQWEQHSWFDYNDPLDDLVTFVNDSTFTVPDTYANAYVFGRVCRCTQTPDATIYAPITDVSTGGGTTTVQLATNGLTSNLSAVAVGPEPVSIPTAGIIPAGMVQAFAGATAPTGWLLCDGSVLDAVTNVVYEDLFDAIGTTYGGTGASNFNLPDLRGRAVFGVDDGQGRLGNVVNGDLGDTGGEERVSLTTDEMPSHSHDFRVRNSPSGGSFNNASNRNLGDRDEGGNRHFTDQNQNTTAAANTIGTAGSGDPHNNLPPAIVMNWLIKI